jgi:class 3 adenylate cyclase
MVIREAIGSAMPSPSDRMREIELMIVPHLEAQLAVGFPPEVVARSIRTMGDSLRRYVLAESEAFRDHVIEPSAQRPEATGHDISRAAAAAQERVAEHADRALLAVSHAQQAQAWTANILDGFERALVRVGLHARVEQPPAMCFLDITGYTELTAERGDRAAAELAEELRRIVERISLGHGGRPVKWLGDGVMLYFRDPGSGVLAALQMAEAVTENGLPPAHTGLHAGPVLIHDGDYYGQTVNIASRIADYARPEEVVVSRAVVDSIRDIPVTFKAVGPVELKGVADPIDLHLAERA